MSSDNPKVAAKIFEGCRWEDYHGTLFRDRTFDIKGDVVVEKTDSGIRIKPLDLRSPLFSNCPLRRQPFSVFTPLVPALLGLEGELKDCPTDHLHNKEFHKELLQRMPSVHVIPADMAAWSVADVSTWLSSLKPKITDATVQIMMDDSVHVDGIELLELEKKDMIDVGVKGLQAKRILRERDAYLLKYA
jgi:hypothetical protein